MWELMLANRIKSAVLLAAMAAMLGGLGYVLGATFGGPTGGTYGLIIAGGIWLVLAAISFFGGDKILLATSGAKKIDRNIHPELFDIVDELAHEANLPKRPNIYIINEQAPNAFATGKSPKSASVAVTAGLLSRLNRDELKGVIAHELSHIVHRDILYVTLAGVMVGSIVLMSQFFLRSMFYRAMFGGMGGRRYSSRSSNQGGAQAIMLIIAIVAAILAPIMAQLLYFALSRKREYLADAGAVQLTRYPQGLAGALEKISKNNVPMKSANKVTAPMYISNPFAGKKIVQLFSTHPPIAQRIKVLRNMTKGASLRDYSNSCLQVLKAGNIMPASAMRDLAPVEIGPGSMGLTAGQENRHSQRRQAGDIMRKVNGFRFANCPCGVRMKIPPNFKPTAVNCPRCGRDVAV